MICWTLAYEGRLILHLEGVTAEEWAYSSFYKLRMRRYISGWTENAILFKESLTYLDMKRIIPLCERQAAQAGFLWSVAPSLKAYIQGKELYIEQRARLGIEIKQQDDRLRDEFDHYAQVVNAAMTRPLRLKQMWDSFFMCVMLKSGNFSVPGSGKTASVLGMFAYLKSAGKVKRLIVICPKNAFGSWMDESVACFGAEEPPCFCLHMTGYSSVAARKKAILYESGRAQLLLFNYESLKTYQFEIAQLIDDQTLLVYDEVHKVKRIHGENATWAVRVAREAHYVVTMTGTPIPNTYADLYNLLHILFPDEYEEFFGFDPSLLMKPTTEDVQEINNKLQPFFCRTTKQQLSVPDAEDDLLLPVHATAEENEVFRILAQKYRKNKLPMFLRVLQLESNPLLLLNSLDLNEFRYILDDDVDSIDQIDYADYSDSIKGLIERIGKTSKFEACLAQAIDLAQLGKTLIVWCIFRDTIQRFRQAFLEAGISACAIYGEVPLENRLKLMEDFRSGRYQVLLSNPHTLAESVSLHTICHDAIYFEYSYNLVHLLQSRDRIHRLGLPDGQYTQYYYLQQQYETKDGAFSMDAKVYERLKEKERIMLEAIDHQTLETMPSNEEDLVRIFAQIDIHAS